MYVMYVPQSKTEKTPSVLAHCTHRSLVITFLSIGPIALALYAQGGLDPCSIRGFFFTGQTTKGYLWGGGIKKKCKGRNGFL
jgi:hypothetical protein